MSLVVFEEYTIAAAASVLNLTPAAAKSRMHRARLRPVTTRHTHLKIRPCETTLAYSRADRYELARRQMPDGAVDPLAWHRLSVWD